ncbi:MAG: hypothetical protein M0Z94_00770 [Dehalococcoidales bacterium]|nr:hypothetical protein [Dehalococcoidales bacterium]
MTLPEAAASVAALLLVGLAPALAQRAQARQKAERRLAFHRQYVVPLQRFARERSR